MFVTFSADVKYVNISHCERQLQLRTSMSIILNIH